MCKIHEDKTVNLFSLARFLNFSGHLYLLGGRISSPAGPTTETLELAADGNAWVIVPELEMPAPGNQEFNAVVYNI